MNKKTLLLSSFISIGLFFSGVAKAMCPICVVAVGAGLGLSRWLGVDDVVSSTWIGALLLALIMWTLTWFKKKGWVFSYDWMVVALAYYLLTYVPLYYAGILGHPLNTIFGLDKIIFGTVVGTVVFLLAHRLHLYLKQKNGGKSFFAYQKVLLPVLSLVLISLLFYSLILLKWI